MGKQFSDKDILNLAVTIRRRLTLLTGCFTESAWETNIDFVDNAIMQEIKKHLCSDSEEL